jgi:hypothetical protein
MYRKSGNSVEVTGARAIQDLYRAFAKSGSRYRSPACGPADNRSRNVLVKSAREQFGQERELTDTSASA